MLDNPCKSDPDNEKSVPRLEGSVLAAECECGEIVQIDTARPYGEAKVCSCGLRAGEGIIRGPHRVELYQQHMPERQAEERAKTEAENVVYFARRGEAVKIGTTCSLPRRLAEHGWPTLLGIMRGGYAKEAEMHRRFRHLRIVGTREWYYAKQELLAFIDEHCQAPEHVTSKSHWIHGDVEARLDSNETRPLPPSFVHRRRQDII